MSDSNGDSNTLKSGIGLAAEHVGNLMMNNSAEVNLTNGTGNVTATFKATPEGLLIAYSSLVFMALVPIIVGSFRSVKHQHKQKVNS
jgi:hypothetical protein